MPKGSHASSVESLPSYEPRTTYPLSLQRLETYHNDTFAKKIMTKDALHGSECLLRNCETMPKMT